MSGRPRIVACIPAYNEEESIAKVILLTKRYVDKVVVCDDGSTDMTCEIAKALGVEVLRHERNMGKGAALKTLFTYAEKTDAEVIVTLDADGQHDPNEIPELVEPIVRGEADVVIGSRFLAQELEMPLYRRVGLKIIDAVTRAPRGRGITDTQSGYRAYSRKVLKTLLQCESTGYGIETETLVALGKEGYRVVEKPIKIRYKGLARTSKKNPLSHGMEIVSVALRLVVEERPLLFLGLPGVALILVGLGAGAYLLWHFNVTRYFSIPVALISLGALFTGVLLLITSLILYAITRLRKYR